MYNICTISGISFWLQTSGCKEKRNRTEVPPVADYLHLCRYLHFSRFTFTDMSRHLHHLTKCPFEAKKGPKGLFLHWEVIANKQTLPY